ncbi:MAG: DUF4917 family protein [Proteobacteria bacterium]|nr:MAG: DUF4917 family protein [Pseudomonadota bacterium]
MGLRDTFEISTFDRLASHYLNEQKQLITGSGFSAGASSALTFAGLKRQILAQNRLALWAPDLEHYPSDNLEGFLRASKGLGSGKSLFHSSKRFKEAFVKCLIEAHKELQNLDFRDIAIAANFLSFFDEVSCLQYDSLLYRVDLAGRMPLDDGFRAFGNFSRFSQARKVSYPHGAVFIGYQDGVPRKLKAGAKTLLEQIQASANEIEIPIILEGSSAQKERRIAENPYLSACYSRLSKWAGVVFIYGASLGESDAHILKQIISSNVHTVAFGIFRPEQQKNAAAEFVDRLLRLKEELGVGRKIRVRFFDTSTVGLWEHQAANRAKRIAA